MAALRPSRLRDLRSPRRCSMHPILLATDASPSPFPATTPGAHPLQGPALPGRPAHRRGGHRGDACGRRKRDGVRLRALIGVLWRAGLRIGEALALAETDLDARRGPVLVRRRQGRRASRGRDGHLGVGAAGALAGVGVRFPVGSLFCVIHGPAAGRNWEPVSARRQPSRTAAAAGVRRRLAPHHYADTLVMPTSLPVEAVCPAQRVIGTCDL